MKLVLPILILTILVCQLNDTHAQQPAFPGAEGGGMFALGGRGGEVYFVTSLGDTNQGNSSTHEGTLRWCLNQPGPKTIIFKVAGIIDLQSRLNVKEFTTIAGQTAPGDGICLRGNSLYVDGNNVIIRYIRSRMGDETDVENDAMWGRNRSDIILDHCSLSWGTDETGSFYDNENFTMQWCILSESLRNSVHGKGAHGYGGIWGGKTASFHHNLLAHHDSRNPRMCGARYSGQPDLELVDFRNNVLYNWGGNTGYAGEGGKYNFVNNYYKAGPESSNKTRIFQPYASGSNNSLPQGIWGTFYVDGNFITESTTVTDDNWLGIHPNTSNGPLPGGTKDGIKSNSEFAVPFVTTHTAEEAYELVLDYAGASFPRDQTDHRVTDEVRNSLAPERASNGTTRAGLIDTQSDVGGWDTYTFDMSEVPVDTDRDGMPDDWEDSNNLDKNDASDRNDVGSDGYTMLEKYINSLVVENNVSVSDQSPGTTVGFMVYPNPVTERLNILITSEFSYSKYRIFDLSGRIVQESKDDIYNDSEISVQSLPSGVYLISLSDEKNTVTRKFTKQ